MSKHLFFYITKFLHVACASIKSLETLSSDKFALCTLYNTVMENIAVYILSKRSSVMKDVLNKSIDFDYIRC